MLHVGMLHGGMLHGGMLHGGVLHGVRRLQRRPDLMDPPIVARMPARHSMVPGIDHPVNIQCATTATAPGAQIRTDSACPSGLAVHERCPFVAL
jgi:hypothetical protein